MVVEPFGLPELKLLPRQVLNEYIPFVGDWCDVTNKELAPGGKCPSWQDPKTAGAHSHRSKAWPSSQPNRRALLTLFVIMRMIS